jgi:hypothetical protein
MSCDVAAFTNRNVLLDSKAETYVRFGECWSSKPQRASPHLPDWTCRSHSASLSESWSFKASIKLTKFSMSEAAMSLYTCDTAAYEFDKAQIVQRLPVVEGFGKVLDTLNDLE